MSSIAQPRRTSTAASNLVAAKFVHAFGRNCLLDLQRDQSLFDQCVLKQIGKRCARRGITLTYKSFLRLFVDFEVDVELIDALISTLNNSPSATVYVRGFDGLKHLRQNVATVVASNLQTDKSPASVLFHSANGKGRPTLYVFSDQKHEAVQCTMHVAEKLCMKQGSRPIVYQLPGQASHVGLCEMLLRVHDSNSPVCPRHSQKLDDPTKLADAVVRVSYAVLVGDCTVLK